MSVSLQEADLTPEQTTKDERVQEQLKRILAADGFKNSRRYTTFLKHVVERKLQGRAGEIKERNLGVEVFGRSPDYDTSCDPVVRITAGEVRRRLAQYYDDVGHSGELRIQLPSGSYVPEFRELNPAASVPGSESSVPGPSSEHDFLSEPPNWKPFSSRRFWILGLMVPTVAAISFAVGLLTHGFSQRVQADPFWTPFLAAASSPVIVSLGEHGALYDGNREIRLETYVTTPGTDYNLRSASSMLELIDHNTLSWADAVTGARLAGWIQALGKNFSVRRSALTPLSDLRHAPSVLIGGFNNKWIMHLTAGLRFSYQHTPGTSVYWIEDRRDPADRRWTVDTGIPPSQFTRDFGIIARVWDPTAEKPTVVVSGTASYGTLAAGELLTTPRYLENLSRRAGNGWEKKNIEAVFSTAVIDGNIGPPEILATHVW